MSPVKSAEPKAKLQFKRGFCAFLFKFHDITENHKNMPLIHYDEFKGLHV